MRETEQNEGRKEATMIEKKVLHVVKTSSMRNVYLSFYV